MNEHRLVLTARESGVSVTVVLDAAMNYALAHNGISPLKAIAVENGTAHDLDGLSIDITLTGPVPRRIAEPLRSRLPRVAAGETLELPGHAARWEFDVATFAQIDEAVTAEVAVHVFDAGRSLRMAGAMRLLARDEWWSMSIHESLTAFVTPRARAIQDLMSDASDLLGQRTGSPSIEGYQGGADRAMAIAGAIYDAMRDRQIRYINPPASFEDTGQKIRPPHEVLVDRWGTCLDLATTYAAALEHAGLNPVLVLCDGHAFAGHLLEEQQLPELVLHESRAILNYVETGLFVPAETTMLCAGESPASFVEAVARTRQFHGWTQDVNAVRSLIDVAASHRTAVRPLPPIHVEDGVRIVEVEREAAAPQAVRGPSGPVAPQVPAVRGGDRAQVTYPPRVDRWRSSLLDLSFRNPLLNMRTGRTALELHVPQGALGTLEDVLFAGQALRLAPHDELAQIHHERGARTAQDLDATTLSSMLVTDHVLFCASTEAAYRTRLRRIQRRARTVTEETGANNLFLTLGMLEWEDNKRQAKAPLFLLPVTLKAQRGRGFTVQIEDGGYPQPNQCLLEKLRISHGLSIPQFREPETDDSGIDLAGSLQAIRRALLDAQLPFSVEESAHLSLLQFSTLQLWQDLSDNWETFLQNPVVRHMVQTPTDSFVEAPDLPAVPQDVEAKAYCPIAIDGAQLQAVSWAEAGRSFVIEGPPGTGKSQTITNLIANAVAAGKTVLFVAEKQAALDVVRRRLDSVGLGDLCLDLHGKDQTSDKMRKQLSAALHLATTSNPQSWDTIRARHQTAVDSLARYPAGLHEPGGARLSAWTARQTLLALGDGPEVEIPAAVVAAPLDVDDIYDAARELTNALYDLGGAAREHLWRLSELRDVSDAARRGRIVAAVRELEDAVAGLENAPLVEVLRSAPDDVALVAIAEWLGTQGGPFLDVASIEAASGEAWRERLQAARVALRALQKNAAPLLATFTPEILEADVASLLARAREADGKLFKGKPRKAIIAELAGVTVDGAAINASTLTATLEQLSALRGDVDEAAGAIDLVPGLRTSDGWNPLRDGAGAAFEAQVKAIEMSVQLVAQVPEVLVVLRRVATTDLPDDAAVRAARLTAAWAELQAAVETSVASSAAWRDAGDSLLDAITGALPAWTADAATSGLVQLGRWAEVQQRLFRLRRAGLTDVVDGIIAGDLHPDAIEDALRRSVARAALQERLSSGALGGFDGTVRDRAIQRFSEGAEEMRRDMVAELPAKIVNDRTFSPDRLVGKVGELSRELSRKRGGLKIRELFAQYGPIVAELTPCLMMSPHSVARFLPAGALDIDLVVFDEASQVRVAEAIGAMGRAKATVVVGDSQQMPPSNIAAVSSGEEDEPIVQGVPSDMESVLSEAVESNLPRLWLSWHYRSKHESLISFSNHQYYEGRLASFPRPPQDHADMGVSWRRIEGTFERGKDRVNRVEAAAIVDEIRSRLGRDPGSSLGVVTFNTQQRDLIMDQLEDCGDPLIAASLAAEADPLFVKNLENVQGDERDVILFSLAFSPDPSTGKLPLNFGPLIQAGGERRLNVAVTRARAQVVLFASFDPSHIDLSRTSSVGLAHLRSYMEMAQRDTDAPGVLRRALARDRHRDDVFSALEETGLCVRKDVGLSDFTVDIAVAPSPDGPWTAVFLDGEDYASRSTVGDRETLPHGVLVGAMGWARVVRVWLPDWVRDPAAVLARIARYISDPAPAAAAAVAPAALAAPVAAAGHRSSAVVVPAAPRLPRFVPAEDRLVGLKEDLDAMAYDAAMRETIRGEIEDVIGNEGPVEVMRLARLVCRRFDLKRVSTKRAADVLALVEPDALDVSPFGTFAWPPGGSRLVEGDFRVPEEDQPRVIEEIAPQELLGAMRFLARTGGGISRDELLRETALLFGTRRLTAKPRAHLESVLTHGVQIGQLREDGVAITCGLAAVDVQFGA